MNAPDKSADQNRQIAETYSKAVAAGLDEAKYLLAGVGALVFFAASYAGGLLDKPGILGQCERIGVAITMVSCFIAVCFCFASFWHQNQMQNIANEFVFAVTADDDNRRKHAGERLKKLTDSRWFKASKACAIGSAATACAISLLAFLLVLF